MSEDQQADPLVARAIEGDLEALTQLLLQTYDQLEHYVTGRIPSGMRSVLAVEDVIQEAHVRAFSHIERFRPEGQDAFIRWLTTIAKQALLDKIKGLNRIKRGGQHKRVHAPNHGSSIATLVEVLACDSATPSRVVNKEERERAVVVALARLKTDYRQALTMRYLHNMPVAEIAKRMDRTERAVHMLCNRGMKKLKDLLGTASLYLSSG